MSTTERKGLCGNYCLHGLNDFIKVLFFCIITLNKKISSP